MSYVDKHHSARNILRNVREQLGSLSRAFERTGNTAVTEELEDLYVCIADAMELYQEAFSTLQQDALDQGRSNIGGLLAVAMKMDELTSKSK